jgi:hypothetical protein
VFNKQTPSFLLMLSFVAVCACAKTSEQDIRKESEQIKQRLCGQKSMADVQSAITSLGIAYDVSDHGGRLNAIKRFNEEALISSAIVIEIHAVDKAVTSCRVEVLHPGP